MDVSGRILRTWMPAIHAGMTRITIFMFCGERKIMEHFVVISIFCGSATLSLRVNTLFRNIELIAGFVVGTRKYPHAIVFVFQSNRKFRTQFRRL
jgi:hypothetical protein